jgi:hypothetical protein
MNDFTGPVSRANQRRTRQAFCPQIVWKMLWITGAETRLDINEVYGLLRCLFFGRACQVSNIELTLDTSMTGWPGS